MGRLEYAMDSLLAFVHKRFKKGRSIGEKLISTNKRRQELTIEALEHARMKIQNSKVKTQNLIFIAHESYQQGVIGLVAGRLAEEFYRPSIVLSYR